MSHDRRQKYMDGELGPAEEAELMADDPQLGRGMLASLYVDGELSPDEVAAFEDQLLASAELQAEVESLFVLRALSMEEPAEASKPAQTSPGDAPLEPGPAQASAKTGPTEVTAATGGGANAQPSSEAPRASRDRRKPRWASRGLVAAAAAIAAVGLLVLIIPPGLPPPGPDRLLIQVIARGDAQFRSRGTELKIGDRLRLTAPIPAGQQADLRVYRAGDPTPVVHCHGPSGCTVSSDAVRAEMDLTHRGQYQVVWIVGPRPAPPPAGSADADAAQLGSEYEVVVEELEVL